MANKILNVSIILLTISIIGVSILLIGGDTNILPANFNSYTVRFELNGADNITCGESITCEFSLSGCFVTLPNIAKHNSEIIGFGLNANDKEATYKVNERIELKNDLVLYAITRRKLTVKIDKSEVDSIESDSVSCDIYNQETECQVTLPQFNKIGYQNVGYSTNNNYKKVLSQMVSKNVDIALVEYYAGEPYLLDNASDGLTLYPKFEAIGGKYSTKSYGLVHNNYLEYTTGCSADKIKEYLDEIYKYAPYLFTNVKINVLNSTSFNNIWGWLGTERAKNIFAVTYFTRKDNWIGSGLAERFRSTAIDLKCDANGVYHTLVHEMVHTWDHYFTYKLNMISLAKINKSNENNVETNYKFLSAYDDIEKLYNKYNVQQTCKNKFYCNRSTSEFTAEVFSHYYDVFLIQKSSLKQSDFPSDIKAMIEKYICIAKNNYNSNGCT